MGVYTRAEFTLPSNHNIDSVRRYANKLFHPVDIVDTGDRVGKNQNTPLYSIGIIELDLLEAIDEVLKPLKSKYGIIFTLTHGVM